MEFFIRQNSTMPILKLQLTDDGKSDKSSFNSNLENSIITLDLIDVDNNVPYILNATCNITNKIKKDNFITDEYFIIHHFTNVETKTKGRYEAKINIQFFNENMVNTDLLILPIKEKLYVNIV